jgi:hypothetical protein
LNVDVVHGPIHSTIYCIKVLYNRVLLRGFALNVDAVHGPIQSTIYCIKVLYNRVLLRGFALNVDAVHGPVTKDLCVAAYTMHTGLINHLRHDLIFICFKIKIYIMHADLINYLCQHLSRILKSQCPSTRTRSGAHVLGTHIQEGHIQSGPHPLEHFFFTWRFLTSSG